MAKRSYSNETKAAVMAALLAGQSANQIAKEYDIPISTIRTWKSAADFGNTINDGQREEIGDLLLDYLRASLKTLKLQVQHFGDVAWLRKQGADQLAVLHGVQMDKAIRLLEALAKNNDDGAA